MPNDGSMVNALPDTRTTVQKVRDMLRDRGMVSSIPELQYQPYFDKSSYYSRKGYAFGKRLKLKRKK